MHIVESKTGIGTQLILALLVIVIVLYLIPVHVKDLSVALLQRLHHSTLLLRRSALVENLEQLVTRGINLHEISAVLTN